MPEFTNFYTHPKMKQYLKKGNNPHFENTHIDLNSRVLIVGASGTGKTNALVQYIALSPNTYSKVIIVLKEMEPLYDFLQEGLKKNITILTDLGKLPTLQKLRENMEKEEEILLVIDDWVNDIHKYPVVNDIFIRGRKCGITTFFLAQSYYRVPKIIRQQMSFLILLKMSSAKDIQLILSDFALKDKDRLREIYEDATRQNLNFLKINCSGGVNINEKFSHNWTDFYTIE
jgi:hypothetical protein